MGEFREVNDAIVNDGIAGVIPDDNDDEGAGTMDGGDVTCVGIKDPIVVDVEFNGDIIIPASCGEVINLVAPGTGWFPATADCVLVQPEVSVPLFVLAELFVMSDEIFPEVCRIPGIPTGNVESIAFIESDCLLPLDGAPDASGKFVNGTRGAWNNAKKEKMSS